MKVSITYLFHIVKIRMEYHRRNHGVARYVAAALAVVALFVGFALALAVAAVADPNLVAVVVGRLLEIYRRPFASRH